MQLSAPPPRHPGVLTPTALDGDFDEELHANVTPPPPPPPPPPRRNSNGNSSHQRVTMMDAEQQHQQQQKYYPPYQQQQQQQHQHRQKPVVSDNREPLDSLTPEPFDQQQQQEHYASFSQDHPQKERIGCDPKTSQYAVEPTSPPKIKTKKPPRSSSSLSSNNRPPKQPTPTGSKSAEYANNIESFHMIMLENIEKETNLIRSQGSFQIHEKNLTNKNIARKKKHQEEQNSENGDGTPKRKSKNSIVSATNDEMTINMNANNVGSLLKETMNDISVAAASTMESLKHVIQHTKDRAASGNGVVKAVAGPMACGRIDDSATAFGMEDNDDDVSDMLDSSADPKNASTPKRSSKSSTPLLRTGSGTDLMKKMNDAFRKVVVDATAVVGGEKTTQSNNKSNENDRHHENENNNSAEAWGVGNLLANGFGWEDDYDDDDIRSRATYDTWDDENSVLRRLGSWGTVNSQFTAGTTGTAATFGTMATYDTEGASVIGPVSVAVAKAAAAKAAAAEGILGPEGNPQNGDQLMIPPGTHHLGGNDAATTREALHDDDGSLINPALVEAALKKNNPNKSLTKKKRRGRRQRKVKFDYPPIKSLKQYTRPDPADLPKLFFTEHELDQIEDDRYSTMSTDDIEIVAVASKETSPQGEGDDDDALDAKASSKKKSGEDSRYEPGMRPVKGRSGTPDRRRSSRGESGSDKKASKKKSSSNNKNSGDDNDTEEGRTSPRRLVKGVQIYLRERSTGT